MTRLAARLEGHIHLIREAHQRLTALYETMSPSAGKTIELEGIERLLAEFLRRADLLSMAES